MSAPAGSRDSSMSMNVVTTVMAFSVSAFFVLFIFIRLLCARIHLRTAAAEHAAAAAHAGDVATLAIHVERGIRGMEPSVVTTFPTAKFGDDSRPTPAQEESQCTVCLEEYEAKDVVRVLPYCGHAFHVACIDAWLKQHSTCPICRASMRATAKHRAPATMRPPVYYAVAMAAPPPPFQVSTSSSDRNATLQAEAPAAAAAAGIDPTDMDYATASGLEISSDEPASSGAGCPSAAPAPGASEDPCSGSTRQSPHGNDASELC